MVVGVPYPTTLPTLQTNRMYGEGLVRAFPTCYNNNDRKTGDGMPGPLGVIVMRVLPFVDTNGAEIPNFTESKNLEKFDIPPEVITNRFNAKNLTRKLVFYGLNRMPYAAIPSTDVPITVATYGEAYAYLGPDAKSQFQMNSLLRVKDYGGDPNYKFEDIGTSDDMAFSPFEFEKYDETQPDKRAVVKVISFMGDSNIALVSIIY